MNIQDKILQLVNDRLKLITTANEYNYDIVSLYRSEIGSLTKVELPAINYWTTGITKSERFKTPMVESFAMSLFLDAYIYVRERPFVDVAGELSADVITSIYRSPVAPKVSDKPDLNLGGFAAGVDLIASSYEVSKEGRTPFCAVLVQFDIHYTTYKGDVYNTI